MSVKRTAQDWTPEAIRRFWEWLSPRPETQQLYFSRQVGRALARILQLAGGLKGEILDFGCGPGYLLKYLCNHTGARCHGVDFSARSVEETRRRLEGVPNFKGAHEIKSLPAPFNAAHFDSITCIETVEHLRDDQLQPLLAEQLRLLKPDGIALFSTPCSEELDRAQAYCPFCDSEFHNMQHLRAFNPAALHDTLTAAGFDVLFCEGVDLLRFQKGKGRKLIDYSPRDGIVALRRGVARGWAALADGVAPRAFPGNRAFLSRLRQGPNLIAVARKPAAK